MRVAVQLDWFIVFELHQWETSKKQNTFYSVEYASVEGILILHDMGEGISLQFFPNGHVTETGMHKHFGDRDCYDRACWSYRALRWLQYCL